MSYCINYSCSHRDNPEQPKCQNCGNPLIIQGVNDSYRLLNPLIQREHPYTEVFEVEAVSSHELRVLKTLKSSSPKLLELFQQEQRILSECAHPGIPQFIEAFSCMIDIPHPIELHCFVMEKIEGEDLGMWLDRNRSIDEETALDWLSQITRILQYVHSQNLFHRDIKPSNIMLRPGGMIALIDFGTVKRFLDDDPPQNCTYVYSMHYTAPEQRNRNPVLQSDFYALGQTMRHLVTRELPNSNRGSERNGMETYSESFIQLLNLLTHQEPENRPRDCQEILDHIQSIRSQRPSEGSYPVMFPFRQSLVYLLLFILSVALILVSSKLYWPSYLSQHSSFGEKSLIESIPLSKNKWEAIQAFQSGKLSGADGAVALFEQARQENPRDPEILIFYNNAKFRLEQQQRSWLLRWLDRPSYEIAVVLPLISHRDQRLINLSQTVLRGVAQRQDEANRGGRINGRSIEVRIVDEPPNEAGKIAKAVTKSLAKAVVGPFDSASMIASFDQYIQGKVIFVTPTATIEDFAKLCRQSRTMGAQYCYRTVPGDKRLTSALARFLNAENGSQTLPIISFYNSQDPYSQSIQEQFCNELNSQSCDDIPTSKLMQQYDLSRHNLSQQNTSIAAFEDSIVSTLKQAKAVGVKTLSLFPSSATEDINKVIAIVNINQREGFNFLMIAGDTLYDNELLVESGESLQGVVFASPWHRLKYPDTKFIKNAEATWQAKVSWETAMAADATAAILHSFENEELRLPMDEAATGVVNFAEDGTRIEDTTLLVTVVKSSCSKEVGYAYTPYDPNVSLTDDPECFMSR